MSSGIDLSRYLDQIKGAISNPREGLPREIFLFISQLTPMVNVDLLIKNKYGHTLLTWRQDELYGPGWHIPGGIIRFKEQALARIQKVAELELGSQVHAQDKPICVREIMAPNRDVRGHFISFLYRCELIVPLDIAKKAPDGAEAVKNGQWKWHEACPENIIPQHEMYREYIDAPCYDSVGAC